jgi:acetyltransferase-like isoleucine patch superfamily enzyme
MFKSFVRKVLYYFLNVPVVNSNVIISGFSRGLKNVTFMGRNIVPDRCNFSGNITIGYATTLGHNNYFGGTITIGKYCQLGADVAIHASNHPINYMTTYINSNLFNGELKDLKQEKEVIIGNDVWIGHKAIILGGVTVGNGAIIAAGSVITKDVEPYTIVAGVPAKVISNRFSPSICKEIENLKWWEMSEDELVKIKPLFFKDFKEASSIFETHK